MFFRRSSPAPRLRRLGVLFAWLVGMSCGIVFLGSRLIPDPLATITAQGSQFLQENPGALRREGDLQVARSRPPASPSASLFLIHGSPGDWQAFAAYLRDPELTSRFAVIVPDRPGYGGSSPNKPLASLADQAAHLAALAESQPGPRIWAGHSFGATILIQLALDYPELTDGLLLIAGAMSPDYERARWYHRLGNLAPVRKILPPEWDSANQEALAFETGMEELIPRWREVKCPVHILHARNDRLADFRHVDFTVTKMSHNPPKIITLESGDHFILWNRHEETKGALLDLARQVTESTPGPD